MFKITFTRKLVTATVAVIIRASVVAILEDKSFDLYDFYGIFEINEVDAKTSGLQDIWQFQELPYKNCITDNKNETLKDTEDYFVMDGVYYRFDEQYEWEGKD